MLKRSGPKTDPCGTPDVISFQVLKILFTLVLCFLHVMQLCINFKAFFYQSHNASNFAISDS